MAKQKMAHMTAYSNGYTPPKGSAGSAAHGQYSNKHNPMSVPKKGSNLSGDSQFGDNADHNKVMMLKREQAAKEGLRGYAC
jgi:hypothetical protein